MLQIEAIQERLSSHFGLRIDAAWQPKIEATLEALSKHHGISAKTLALRALVDISLLRHVAGALTVEESFFFRHRDQYARLTCFVGDALKEDRVAPIRIWSAGCAAGQEPYSVAISLARQLDRPSLRRITILASDVNNEALKRGRSGTFSKWSLRDTDEATTACYFKRNTDGSLQLAPEMCSMVRFEHLSIQEVLAKRTTFDVILFRNVAVYMSRSSIEQLYEAFARALNHRGLLFIGAADPRPQNALLASDSGGDTTLFRRGVSAAPSRTRAVQKTAARPPQLASSRVSARVLATAGAPPRLAVQTPGSNDAAPAWADARALADRGEFAEALSICDTLIDKDPTAKDGYFLRGMIHVEGSDTETAIDDFRRVLYFDPTDDVTRYWYALALHAAGRFNDALQQTVPLIKHLRSRDDARSAELLDAALALKGLLE